VAALRNGTFLFMAAKVSAQGVVAFGGHFATLSQGVDFYAAKKMYYDLFSKREGKYFYTFNHSFSERSLNTAT